MAVEVTSPAAPDVTLRGNLKLDRCPAPESAREGENVFSGSVDFEKPAFGMRPGMRASARIVTEKLEDVLVVPRSAVIGDGEEAHCFVAGDGGDVRRVAVKTGPGNGGEVVIHGDLEVGQRILVPATER
jgi:multidrug efflux pump subunit AcrA (membrane-fusion protein)